ncbi:hypothetical protein V8G54_023924 [Vigna mungo]|uniref:PB1-like domain-containing protein n=1 Tax=Vigna mungo TaxID=3915 RepID=A0AAQ3N6C9_VIGMU
MEEFLLESINRLSLSINSNSSLLRKLLSVVLVHCYYSDGGIAGSSLVCLRSIRRRCFILREVFGGGVSSFVKIQRRCRHVFSPPQPPIQILLNGWKHNRKKRRFLRTGLGGLCIVGPLGQLDETIKKGRPVLVGRHQQHHALSNQNTYYLLTNRVDRWTGQMTSNSSNKAWRPCVSHPRSRIKKRNKEAQKEVVEPKRKLLTDGKYQIRCAPSQNPKTAQLADVDNNMDFAPSRRGICSSIEVSGNHQHEHYTRTGKLVLDCIKVVVAVVKAITHYIKVSLEMVFEIRLHHMGRFVNDKGLRYVGGEVHVIVGVDPDRWSYFGAVGIIKEFKYDADFKLWWKGSREILMNNVRLLSNDREAMNLAKYAEETEDMVEIYVQHVPSEAVEVLFLTCGEETHDGNMEGVAEIVEEGGMSVQQGHASEEHIEVQIGEQEVGNDEEEAHIGEEEVDIGEEEAEIGEEEVDIGEEEAEIGKEEVDCDGGHGHDYVDEEEETWRNVVEGEVEASAEEFVDENEEERMDNDDDGFGVENDRVDDVRRNINPVLERRDNVGEGSFVMDDEVGDHEINEEYNSDELDSDLESDGDDNFKRGKFKKFRQDDMNKDFRFSLGLEFCSLKEFKNALMEHSVLNGKEIKFVKNDLTRSFSVGITAWKAGKAKQIALDSLGCKQGFLGSCRPFIGVDGCHLKTTYGGQLLVAVGRDPNDQYFPLAFAVFLDDIDGTKCQRWVFISDQQKGLMTVFDDMMDGVEHRLCLRHLYNNFKKDLMMRATKATYEKEWEKKMGELKAINIDAYNLLLGIPTKSWEKAMTYPGVLMPRPRKRLDKEIEKSGNWIPTWAGAEKFEVTHDFTMDKFVVDLRIPCRHAIAAINYKVQNPEYYVHVYYKKQAYVTCYAPEIVPINGQQMWPTSENTLLLLPPIYKTPLGRPKKLRRRETDEPVSHTKLSKKHAIMKCSNCKEFGHNVRSCRRKNRNKVQIFSITTSPNYLHNMASNVAYSFYRTQGVLQVLEDLVAGPDMKQKHHHQLHKELQLERHQQHIVDYHSVEQQLHQEAKLQEEQPQDWVHTISVPKPVPLDQAGRRPFFNGPLDVYFSIECTMYGTTDAYLNLEYSVLVHVSIGFGTTLFQSLMAI